MLEVIVGIILIPLAIGAIFISSAMIVGIIKGIKKGDRKK